LGHAQQCDGVKSVNLIPTLPSTAINARGFKNELSHVECFHFGISSSIAEGE
jgi:hypothetical protein